MGADATNLNWSETYTALQQNTVEGQENPLPAIDAASVQEVQPYCSMWDAIYDCLFFCINQDIYDGLTPQQQAVVDECGQKAVEYERYINRSSDNEIKERWESKNGVTFTEKADMDIDSFKKAVDGVDDWFVNELKSQGYEDGQDLVDLFTIYSLRLQNSIKINEQGMKFHQITMNFIPRFVFNNIERKVLDIFYFSRYTEQV